MFRLTKTVLAIGIGLKCISVALNHFDNKKKLKTPLNDEFKNKYLKENPLELSLVLNSVSDFFLPADLTEDLDAKIKDDLKKKEKGFLNIESSDYMSLKISTKEKQSRNAHFKIISMTGESNTVDFMLRLTFDDWNGYIDINMFNLNFYSFINESIFIINNSSDLFKDKFLEGSILSYRFIYTNDLINENEKTTDDNGFSVQDNKYNFNKKTFSVINNNNKVKLKFCETYLLGKV